MRPRAQDGPIRVSETRYARAEDGSALAYRVAGDGPVDLVWSSSFLSDVELVWEYGPTASFFRALAGISRLILHDRRGMGRSDHDATFPDLGGQARDLLSVLDAAGCERPVLAGPEIGGALSAHVAARYPERVAGLLWYGPFARSASAPDYPWGSSDEELQAEERETLAGWATEGFAARFVARNAPSMAGDPAAAGFFARFMGRSLTSAQAVALSRLWHGVDLRSELASIGVPTLAIARGGDPPEEERYAMSLIPGGRLLELPGEDYIPFFGDSGSIVDAVRGFVGAR